MDHEEAALSGYACEHCKERTCNKGFVRFRHKLIPKDEDGKPLPPADIMDKAVSGIMSFKQSTDEMSGKTT